MSEKRELSLYDELVEANAKLKADNEYLSRELATLMRTMTHSSISSAIVIKGLRELIVSLRARLGIQPDPDDNDLLPLE